MNAFTLKKNKTKQKKNFIVENTSVKAINCVQVH